MKKQSEGIARHRMTVFTVLILLAITAAACSSGGSNSLSSNSHTSKPANTASMLEDAYSQASHAPNITEDISMDIKYNGFTATQGTSAASLRKEEKILSEISNINIIASVSRSVASGKGPTASTNELIAFDYKSTPLAEIFATILKPNIISGAYFRVYISNIANLPLPYQASDKRILGEIGLLIQPTWYKLPHSLLSAIEKSSSGSLTKTGQISAGQIQRELQNPKLESLLKNLTNSLLTQALSVTSVANQGGEDVRFSGNYEHLLKWLLPQYKNIAHTLYPKANLGITKSYIDGVLAKTKSGKLQDDTLSGNIEISSANLLTGINMSTKIVNPKNQKQYLVFSLNNAITYPNTAISVPNNAVTLPSILVNPIIQKLNMNASPGIS